MLNSAWCVSLITFRGGSSYSFCVLFVHFCCPPCSPCRPSNVWNQYDFYLVPSAAYSSTKKACFDPLHVLYSYDDASIWAVNSLYTPSARSSVVVEAFTVTGAPLFNETYAVPELAADSTLRLGVGPDPGAMKKLLGGLGRTYFVRLRVPGDAGGGNVYVLSTTPDVLDWSKAQWDYTPCSSYGNMTELRTLPHVPYEFTATPLDSNTTSVVISLPATSPAVLFFARVRLLNASNADVAPASYSDNFITLRPGEAATVVASYDGARVGPTTVVVEAFNDVAGRG